jgi:uncharacterized protein DUF4158
MDEGYGRFGSYSRVEMERFFHLDDEDRRLVAMRRRDYNRLGFAVQMVTVRHLGMFLPDPLDVPLELVEYLAEQLGIDDPSCVKSYLGCSQGKHRTRHGLIRNEVPAGSGIGRGWEGGGVCPV